MIHNKSKDDKCDYIDDDIDNANTGDPMSELDDGGEASTSMGSGHKRQSSTGGITTPLKNHRFYDPDDDLDLLYISPPTTQEFSSFFLSQDPASVPLTTHLQKCISLHWAMSFGCTHQHPSLT